MDDGRRPVVPVANKTVEFVHVHAQRSKALQHIQSVFKLL